jgi:hypothetical protein
MVFQGDLIRLPFGTLTIPGIKYMSMRYLWIFTVPGVLLVGASAILVSYDFMFSIILGYLGFSLVLLGLAYYGIQYLGFHKRHDGGCAPWKWLMHGPYLAIKWVWCDIQRTDRAWVPYSQVAPNLYLGGRLSESAARDAIRRLGLVAVFDLEAEFSGVSAFRRIGRYLASPTLDFTSPSPCAIDMAVRWIDHNTKLGPVYIHCALGHGRSATVVAAYLMYSNAATTLDQVIIQIKNKRQKVRLNSKQICGLKNWILISNKK